MPRLLLLALVLCACDTAAVSDAADLVVTPTDEGYLIETEADYPCSNVPLVIDVDVDEDIVTVEVEGVGEADVCLTAIGPARAIVSYPTPTGEGNPTHELAIEKGGAVDRYLSDCGVIGCTFLPAGRLTFTRLGPR